MCKEVLFPLAAGLPSVSEGFDSFLQLFGLFPLTEGLSSMPPIVELCGMDSSLCKLPF